MSAPSYRATLTTYLSPLRGKVVTLAAALLASIVQRSAAARMLATEAELLVFDDLSSALDLNTEAELWRRLFEQREATCLVVSHRRAALERADQIVLLDQGQLIGKGTLEELLSWSPLMRDLWATGER